jgi:hypothetical protein
MVVFLRENARIKLFGNRLKGVPRFDWIRNLLLDVTRRLIARFRMIFHAPAAIVVYLIFKCSANEVSRVARSRRATN